MDLLSAIGRLVHPSIAISQPTTRQKQITESILKMNEIEATPNDYFGEMDFSICLC